MIEKNHERARFTRFPRQGWWWFNLFGRLIGYGYAPWRAFAISVAMILLGWFLFYQGFSHDLISPTRENAYVKTPNGHLVLGKSGRWESFQAEYPALSGDDPEVTCYMLLARFKREDQSVLGDFKPFWNAPASVNWQALLTCAETRTDLGALAANTIARARTTKKKLRLSI